MTKRAPLSVVGRNPVLAGILLMLAGNLFFSLNDAMGKWLVASFSVGQVLLVRSIGAFLVLTPLLLRQSPRSLFRVDKPMLHLLRVVLATADTGFFYAAVVYLPLADVMTFYMAGPIYVAAFSHFFLGEKVGWRRWAAILIGFCGVLIALRPSSASLSLASLYALVGSMSFAMTLVLARRLRTTSDATLVTWQTLGALLTGWAMMGTDWQTPSPTGWLGLILLGVVSSTAHMMITRSLKLADASTLAPLQYTLLLWAIVFGFAFFGDIPDRMIVLGSLIIVFAGLFIFHRQNIVDKNIPETVPRDIH